MDDRKRIHTRISDRTARILEDALPRSNARTQNEFVEEAIQFYANYVLSKDDFSMLPGFMVSAMRATVQSSEDRIARLLFKLAVEMSMTMNIVAAGKNVSDEDLEKVRNRCSREVKANNGQISLQDAMHYQHSD